jgi:flavin-binding protein dodecin
MSPDPEAARTRDLVPGRGRKRTSTDVRALGGYRPCMTEHVYKTVEITGSSPEGVTQAIDRAIAKASQTLRNLDWFEVASVRGQIAEGHVAHYQVTLKVGFRLED